MVTNIKRVLISDPVDPICAQILELHGLDVTFARQWPKEKLIDEIKVRTDDLSLSTALLSQLTTGLRRARRALGNQSNGRGAESGG